MFQQFILLFLLATPLTIGSISLESIGDMFSAVHEVASDILRISKLLKPSEGEHFDLPYVKNKEKNILKKIAQVNQRVENIDRAIQSASSASKLNLKQDFTHQIRLELRLDTFLELVSIIDFADHKFKEYSDNNNLYYSTETGKNRTTLEQLTLESFATYVVSHTPSSVQGVMDRLHSMVHPDTDQDGIFMNTGILTLLSNALQESENSLCHVQQSPQQIIYNLYNSIQMTQLKGYTMMQFSWMLLRLYKKGNFTLESRLMHETYMKRMVEQVASLKEALKEADSAFWMCDPKHQVEGETYLQLTRLLQGYVQNEVDMNPRSSCEENCGYYQNTKQYGCYENNFCVKQRSCNGDIVECQYIDSDMWVCQADPLVSRRRYEWIEYENGRVLGNKASCQRKSKVDSWWRWIFWHCSFCFCLCDDDTNSDRYFSLHKVLSTTDANKVITGVRFVKMNGVVHIQIQEGKLKQFGHIEESSLAWQPIDNFQIKGAVEGKDYIRMSYTKRGVDLDDLMAPPEHIITGIKFRMVGSHLNLEIRATPFNFSSGELLEPGNKDQWISNDNTDVSATKPREKLPLDAPDNPLNSLSMSTLDSKNDMYLEFTYSDINKDAAQTTVPFLDAQMVAPQPPVPLSGIGVYHKGVKWFGGFIGLKVFTYNLGDHVKANFSDLNNLETVN